MQQGIAFGERASFPSEQNPETGGRIPAGVEQTAGHDE